MENKRILVIGGTGFIGQPLTRKLKEAGFDITLLIKRGEKMAVSPEYQYFAGDLLDKKSLQDNINNFDLVINLAAIVRTTDKKKYTENVEGIKNLTEVLEEKGIKKLLHFSTQNVNLKEKGPYAKSKELSEEVIKNSKLDYLIVRPNYVYEINRANDFYKIAGFISKFRLAPIVGNGNYKIQPVLREDLINAVVCLANDFFPHSTFVATRIAEISGRETLSINEIVKYIGDLLKITPFKIHVPVFFLKLFQGFIPFDVAGYTEDRISKNPFPNNNFSLFSDNLKEIIKLLK